MAEAGCIDFAGQVRQGRFLLGTFVKTPSHQNVELLGQCGLDFVVLDAEHAPFGISDLDVCLMAARMMKLPALVRVASPRHEAIMQALDLGATGFLAPHVDSAQAASDCASAARYRGGRRGYSNSPRAGNYGLKSLAQTLDDGDRTTAVVCQIEDREALQNIDAIAATPDIDCLFIGRADLAVSLGVESLDAPVVQAAVRTVCEAGRRQGVAVGLFLPDARQVAAYREMGVSVFVVGSDQSLLQGAARELACALKG